jgi:hypothetical protein
MKTFVGELGEKINEKGNEIAEKARYVLEIVKGKTGKAVGFVRDAAGNIADIITENLPAVAKAVAVSGLIAVGGIMTSCDGPHNPGSQIEDPEKTGEGEEKTWKDVTKNWRLVSAITPDLVEEGYVNGPINRTAVAVANETENMDQNLRRFGAASLNPDLYKGAPTEAYVINTMQFHYDYFTTGRSAIDTMVGQMSGDSNYLGNNNPALFNAYMDALRGMYFMSARHNKTDDYTTQFNLGNGAVSVGSLLDAVTAIKNTETYTKFGAYPISAVKNAAVGMLPDEDNAYGYMGRGIITEIGNFEQLLAVIQHGKALGMDTSFVGEAITAIGHAVSTIMSEDITIQNTVDLPLTQSQSIGLSQ